MHFYRILKWHELSTVPSSSVSSLLFYLMLHFNSQFCVGEREFHCQISFYFPHILHSHRTSAPNNNPIRQRRPDGGPLFEQDARFTAPLLFTPLPPAFARLFLEKFLLTRRTRAPCSWASSTCVALSCEPLSALIYDLRPTARGRARSSPRTATANPLPGNGVVGGGRRFPNLLGRFEKPFWALLCMMMMT